MTTPRVLEATVDAGELVELEHRYGPRASVLDVAPGSVKKTSG